MGVGRTLGISLLATWMTAAGALADISNKLFDVQFGAFNRWNDAQKRAKVLKTELPETLHPYVEVDKVGKHYVVWLNANTTLDVARDIKDSWTKDNTVAVVKDIKLYGNEVEKNTHSIIPIKNGLQTLITRYLTAYSNGDIKATRNTLVNKFAPIKTGDFVAVNTDWLKPHLRGNLQEGKDYQIVHINKDDPTKATIFAIASNYASGRLDEAVNAILDFNVIQEGQEKELWNNIPIAVPTSIYHDPRNIRSIEETLTEDFEEVAHEGIQINGKIEKGNYYVLNNTKIPSVLVESFFMTNPGDLWRYRQKNNLEHLAIQLAAGADHYGDIHKTKNIVLAVGHGHNDPGAVVKSGRKAFKEVDFNRAIVKIMDAYLEKQGYTVTVLDYPNKKGSQIARLRNYVHNANRFSSSNSIFISVHCNSAKNTQVSGTRIYGPSPLQNNPKSSELGRILATYAQQ